MRGGIGLITKEKKERLCKEHKMLLELVYYFGKGIMFRQHILRYMNDFEGIHEINISKSLLELKANEIIDFQNLYGAKIIKLKKFAIFFLSGKERDNVTSVKFTLGKAKKSAYLNQIILNNTALFKKKGYSLDAVMNYYLKSTTYFTKDKESFIRLENDIRDGYTEQFAEEEVKRLVLAKEKGRLFKKTSDEKLQYSYNLNSIQSSNLFLGMRRKRAHTIVQFVDILDINGSITSNKLARKVNETMDYLNLIYDPEKINFHFVLYVQSDERKEVLLKHNQKINKQILIHCRKLVSWEVVN